MNTVILTDAELQILVVAMQNQMKLSNSVAEKFPNTRKQAAEVELLAERLLSMTDYHLDYSGNRGDREDFHSDG